MSDISLEPLLNTKYALLALDGYVLSDKDDDASPNYYGYVNKDGEWYVMKETILAGADNYRFAKGAADYITNYTNRAGLSYDYFYNVF